MQRHAGGGGGTDDDIKKQGEPAQAAFPVLFVVLPAYLEKFLHLLPEPCRMGRRKRRSGKGMGGGGESRAEEEKKKQKCSTLHRGISWLLKHQFKSINK